MKFTPYKASHSNKTIDEVFNLVNTTIYQNHCQANSPVKIEVLDNYRRVLKELLELGVDFIPFRDADFSKSQDSGSPTCLIRHDLDIDIVTAVQMAKIEHDLGVRSSWYILHTAPYYGHFLNDGEFLRHQSMRHVYKHLQDLGHEIALHTDGLHVYQNQKRDGAEAIEAEIQWLRESGLDIVGTTAHNSRSIYGAENFAIFKGRPERGGSKPGECPKEIIHNGNKANLQVLCERSLGLHYEANEIFWQNKAIVRYAAIRGQNNWRWSDKQSRIETPPSGATIGFTDNKQVIHNFSFVKNNEWLVLVIHPVYYGYRRGKHLGPSISTSFSDI